MISLGERKCHEVGFLKSAFPNSWHTWLEHQSNPCFPRFSESRKFMKHGLECSLELGTPELDPVTSLKAWVSLSPSRSQAQETWEGLSNLSGSWNSYMFRILRGCVCPAPKQAHLLRWLGGIIFLRVRELKSLHSPSQSFCGSVLFIPHVTGGNWDSDRAQLTSEDKLEQMLPTWNFSRWTEIGYGHTTFTSSD